MTDLDRQTQAAIEALVHRLKNRGDDDGQFATDPEVFAQEFMAAMRGRGWRPVDALSKPAPEARRANPNDDWQQARAALEQKLHRPAGEVA